jgi:hypothetical protein
MAKASKEMSQEVGGLCLCSSCGGGRRRGLPLARRRPAARTRSIDAPQRHAQAAGEARERAERAAEDVKVKGAYGAGRVREKAEGAAEGAPAALQQGIAGPGSWLPRAC